LQPVEAMSFRIDHECKQTCVVLRLHGRLLGWEAENLLREQIVHAATSGVDVEIDASEVTALDAGCLAAIENSLGRCLVLGGGGAYLKALLRR
jgi:anti-anti-sigma regulatory factor